VPDPDRADGSAGPATAHDAVRIPEPRETLLLAVAVAAVSTSAPIIAACTAPALAIAFWRCLLGGLATAPWVLRHGWRRWRALTPAQWRGLFLAGAFLAAHFATWVPSLRFTSVASAAALVATQPVWAALIARAGGAAVNRGVWVGIVVSLVGVVVLTGLDFSLDPRSLIGDALALVGAVLAAAYVTAGERSRQTLGTGDYTLAAYLTSAALLLPVCLVFGAALAGYSTRDWLLILALTAIAQLLGHTLINHALQTTSATVVSLAILFELPGAVLIAAVWLRQLPPLEVLPALVLLSIGLVIVIRSARSRQPLETPPA
jgi:drug/metabolite transporter (DMT)-like permease